MSLKPKLKDVVSSDISDSFDPSSHNGGLLSLFIYTWQLGTFDFLVAMTEKCLVDVMANYFKSNALEAICY